LQSHNFIKNKERAKMVFNLGFQKEGGKITATFIGISGNKIIPFEFPLNSTIKGVVLDIQDQVKYHLFAKLKQILIRFSSGRTYCYINEKRITWSAAKNYGIKNDLLFLVDIMDVVLDLSDLD
jgi:hypothetical protein